MARLLKIVYDHLFKEGINIMYGRPGVGKSRLAYSISQQYKPDSLLVIPGETTCVENVDPDAVLSNIEDSKTLIRVASMTYAKVIIIDSISRFKKGDLIDNMSRMKNMGERENAKFIFMAQVRVEPSTHKTYPHNVVRPLEEHADEVVEMIAVSKDKDRVVTLLVCRTSGRRITIPIPRAEGLVDKHMYRYIQESGEARGYDQAIDVILKTLDVKRTKKGSVLRW